MTGHLRGDARKRDDDPHDFPIRDLQTTAGQTALRAAAAHLADIPNMQGVRVWLEAFAGTYRAGGA